MITIRICWGCSFVFIFLVLEKSGYCWDTVFGSRKRLTKCVPLLKFNLYKVWCSVIFSYNLIVSMLNRHFQLIYYLRISFIKKLSHNRWYFSLSLKKLGFQNKMHLTQRYLLMVKVAFHGSWLPTCLVTNGILKMFNFCGWNLYVKI